MHIEARQIVRLRKALNNLSYTEQRDWNSTLGRDRVAGWQAVSFGLVMVKSRKRKLSDKVLFTRMVKLNSTKKDIIEQLGVEVGKYFEKKKQEVVKKAVEKKYSEEEYMERVFEAQS